MTLTIFAGVAVRIYAENIPIRPRRGEQNEYE